MRYLLGLIVVFLVACGSKGAATDPDKSQQESLTTAPAASPKALFVVADVGSSVTLELASVLHHLQRDDLLTASGSLEAAFTRYTFAGGMTTVVLQSPLASKSLPSISVPEANQSDQILFRWNGKLIEEKLLFFARQTGTAQLAEQKNPAAVLIKGDGFVAFGSIVAAKSRTTRDLVGPSGG
jgi:hypothetical protein